MPPWNFLKSSTGHFDGVGGVFTLSGLKHAPLGRVITAQLSVDGDIKPSRHMRWNTGEKIFIVVILLFGVVVCFAHLLLAAIGAYGYFKKQLAILLFWILFWVAIIFSVVFIAKTFWNLLS